MEPKSVRCVFLGYDAEKRGYRLLNVASQRVIVTRDVVFNEALFPARKARDEIRRRELESISGQDEQLLPEAFVDVESNQQGVCAARARQVIPWSRCTHLGMSHPLPQFLHLLQSQLICWNTSKTQLM